MPAEVALHHAEVFRWKASGCLSYEVCGWTTHVYVHVCMPYAVLPHVGMWPAFYNYRVKPVTSTGGITVYNLYGRYAVSRTLAEFSRGKSFRLAKRKQF
jgi:hypothetical protein